MIAPLLPISSLGQMVVIPLFGNGFSLEQQSQSFDILWFKLADSPRFESEMYFIQFFMVVTDLDCFGVGGISRWAGLHEDAPIELEASRLV